MNDWLSHSSRARASIETALQAMTLGPALGPTEESEQATLDAARLLESAAVSLRTAAKEIRAARREAVLP